MTDSSEFTVSLATCMQTFLSPSHWTAASGRLGERDNPKDRFTVAVIKVDHKL